MIHHLVLILGFFFEPYLIRFIEMDLNDRDQWKPQITHFFQQAIQRGLIGYRSGEKRITILFQDDSQIPQTSQPTEIPVGP